MGYRPQNLYSTRKRLDFTSDVDDNSDGIRDEYAHTVGEGDGPTDTTEMATQQIAIRSNSPKTSFCE